ncbi:MAG TPA: hypothetical protein VF521_08655 [Pyrinomonadaceae bacterium]
MKLENLRLALDRFSKRAGRLSALRTPGIILYVVVLPLLLVHDFLRQIIKAGPSRAWDGTGFYGIAQVYSNHIFPDTFGWTSAYFAGMPFPNFYPPLFFWCVALLQHTHLLSFGASFKLMVFLPMLLAPAAMWLLGWTVSNRDRSIAFWTAGLSLVPLVSTRFGGHFRWASGLDYFSTFAIGMYTQPLGFILLVVWYVAYIRAHRSVLRFSASCVLLALAVLANYLNGVTSVLFVSATLIFDLFACREAWRAGADERRRALKTLLAHTVSPAVSLALALFWIVPMFSTYEYLVTRPYTSVIITEGMMMWFVVAVLGTLFWLRRPTGAARPYVLTCLVLASILIFSAQMAPRWYPLQANRFAPTLNFLLSVPVAYALVAALRWLRSLPERRSRRAGLWVKTLAPYVFAAFLVLTAAYWFRASFGPNSVFFFRTMTLMGFYPSLEGNPAPGPPAPAPEPGVLPAEFEGRRLDTLSAPELLEKMYKAEHSDDFATVKRAAATVEHILRFADGHRDGRYLVELPNRYLVEQPAYDAYAVNSYLGAQGNETLTIIFREASPNSLCMYPQVSALSYTPDSFGLSSLLADDIDFAEQPTAKHLERARLLGMKYLVVHTQGIKEQLAREPLVGARFDFGDWSVFELNADPPPPVRALPYKPALVVSKLTLKGRYSNEYNFIRLAEEQFSDGWFDVLLVRSPTMMLDELGSLTELKQRFGGIVLDSYDCERCELVYRQLRGYSQTHPLILLSDDSSLFNRIRSGLKDFPLAQVVERTPDADGEGAWLSSLGPTHRYGSSAIRRQWAQIRAALEAHKVPVEPAAVGGEVKDGSIRIDYRGAGDGATPTEVPVLVSTSFHPNWQADDGGTVYAANPMFMLVYVSKPTSLSFARRPLDRAGVWATVGTLFALLCFTAWGYGGRLVPRRRRALSRQPATEPEAPAPVTAETPVEAGRPTAPV